MRGAGAAWRFAATGQNRQRTAVASRRIRGWGRSFEDYRPPRESLRTPRSSRAASGHTNKNFDIFGNLCQYDSDNNYTEVAQYRRREIERKEVSRRLRRASPVGSALKKGQFCALKPLKNLSRRQDCATLANASRRFTPFAAPRPRKSAGQRGRRRG